MTNHKVIVDTLYTGGDILTLDKSNPIIKNGAIAVSGNKIVAIGKADDVKNKVSCSGRIVDFSDLVMMPGLVDAHTHLFQSLGKTLGDGMSLLPWLAKFMMPLSANIKPEDAVAAVKLASLNAALSGTTSIVDNHYAPVDTHTTLAVASAIEEVGVRGAVARGIYGPFVEGSKRMNCDKRLFQYTSKEELTITEECLLERPHGSLVEIWPTPENVVYLDPELMIATHELAAKHNVQWHAHCSESKFEVDIFESVYGMRPAKWLHQQGILDHRTTLAHGIWFDEEEVQLLGESGAHIVHNPISNQYLASGIIKLQPLMKAGANVTLGSDGAACLGMDMFEAIKSAQILQHLRELDPESANSELALCMATRNGGKMLKKDVGILKEGAVADFIMLDNNGVHKQPQSRIVCSIAQSTRGSDVKHVVVNGELIVENGRSTKIDQEKVIADAVQASSDLIDRAGIRELVVDWNEPEYH